MPNTKAIKNFVICLLSAVIMWISLQFSQSYRYTFSYPVSFESKYSSNTQIQQSEKNIQVTVTANGFEMLYYRLSKNKKQLRFYIDKLKPTKEDKRAVFFCKQYKEAIFRQLGYRTLQIAIQTDSIVLTWETLQSKKVTPVLKVNLEFQQQYELYGSPTIYPNQVTVYGTPTQLKKISEVYTFEETLTNLDKSVYHIFQLKKPEKYPEISMPLPYVYVYFPIEKYTQIEVEVPIQTPQKDREQIRVFPNKAKIISLVALKDYKRVTPEMFNVSIDYDSEKGQGDMLPLELVHFPDFVKFQKIQPEKVDYVIIQK